MRVKREFGGLANHSGAIRKWESTGRKYGSPHFLHQLTPTSEKPKPFRKCDNISLSDAVERGSYGKKDRVQSEPIHAYPRPTEYV
jgi:hypothetical protein